MAELFIQLKGWYDKRQNKSKERKTIPGPQPSPIQLTARERISIEELANSRTREYPLVQRANMMIAMAAGANHQAVARRTKSNRHSVRRWRRRWLEASQRLAMAEKQAVDERLRRNIIEAILRDKYRSGAPPQFTPEQIVQIVAISCEQPVDSGRPIRPWTPRELAEEAIKRKIVERLSPRSAGRFLKGDGITAAASGVLVKRQA